MNLLCKYYTNILLEPLYNLNVPDEEDRATARRFSDHVKGRNSNEYKTIFSNHDMEQTQKIMNNIISETYDQD